MTINISIHFLILIIIYVIFQAQNFLVIVIVAAIIDFIVGAIIGPTDVMLEAEGFTGFNREYGMDCR